MMNDVRIVAAEEKDLAAIEALARRIWPACYRELLTPEQISYMLHWMYRVDRLRMDMAEGVRFDRLFLGAEMIGFTAYGPYEAGVCKLHKLYMLVEHHGKGLGSALLKHVIAQARDLGFRELVLNVNKYNTKAQGVYKRHGFTITRSEVNDIGNGYVMDDYVLGLKLDKDAL